MKLYPNPKKIVFYHLAFGVVTAAVFYLMFGSPFNEFTYKHILLITVPLISALIFGIIAVRRSYYEVDRKKIIYRRGSKTYEYAFSMIAWIDQAHTKKHHVMRFYTTRGDEIFLPLDKDAKLYQYTLERVPRLWTFDELKAKFPKASK